MERKTFTAFAGPRRLCSGSFDDVVAAVRRAIGQGEHPVLVFDDATGAQTDLDLRLPVPEPGKAGESENVGSGGRPRGRPKLGVVAREVTLLPRHWQWLAAQPGGASVALRKLVDAARKADEASPRAAREAAYRFMSAMAGDLPGFEEAAKALFAGDGRRLAGIVRGWPEDVAAHALRLAGVPPPDG